jgi:hypothetical protein
MPCCPRWTTEPSPRGCFGTRGAGWRTLPVGPGTPRLRRGPRGRFRIGWEPPPAPAASAIRPEQIRKGRWRCRRGPAGCCWSTHDAATIRPPDAPPTSLPQPWRTTSRWRRCRRRTFRPGSAPTHPARPRESVVVLVGSLAAGSHGLAVAQSARSIPGAVCINTGVTAPPEPPLPTLNCFGSSRATALAAARILCGTVGGAGAGQVRGNPGDHSA